MSLLKKLFGKKADTEKPENIPENALWIDCRALDEYQGGHLEDAIHIPHSEMAERHHELNVDKSQPLYLYCAGGKRAEMAKQCLEAEGYQQVVNVGGLKDALKQSGKQ